MQVLVPFHQVNLANLTTGEDAHLDASCHPPGLAQGRDQGHFLLVVLIPGVVVCLLWRVMEVMCSPVMVLSEIQVENRTLTLGPRWQAQDLPTKKMERTDMRTRETISMKDAEKARDHRTGGWR
jgi:hypothetical protein